MLIFQGFDRQAHGRVIKARLLCLSNATVYLSQKLKMIVKQNKKSAIIDIVLIT